MIRTGRALFTAHTNADSASPGVSDALADALGLTVEEVLAPIVDGPDLDKWVVFVPAENADAVREAMFAAGAGRIGDYSHCSWSATGTGQFLPHDGASPAIGSVGTVEQRVRGSGRGDRAVAAAGSCSGRDACRASRTRNPRSTSSPWRPFPATSDWAASARCRAGAVVGVRIPGARRAARHVVGGARLGRLGGHGVAGGGVRRSGRFAARRRRRCRRAGLRHRRPASPPRRRAPAGIGGGARRRRALGQRVPVVRTGGADCCAAISATRCRCGYRPSVPIHGTSRERVHES